MQNERPTLRLPTDLLYNIRLLHAPAYQYFVYNSIVVMRQKPDKGKTAIRGSRKPLIHATLHRGHILTTPA